MDEMALAPPAFSTAPAFSSHVIPVSAVRFSDVHTVVKSSAFPQSLALSQTSGFTFIEVLVALMLLSLSVLGYATLQGQALAITQQTFWRAQAYDLAEQLSVVVRLHPAQRDFFLQAADWQMPSVPMTLRCVGRQACTAEQLAQADIDQLKTQAFLQLPQAQIQIRECMIGVPQYCVKVAWSGQQVASCDAAVEGCLSLPLAVSG
jgi:type IV pilus assembly protein PilV